MRIPPKIAAGDAVEWTDYACVTKAGISISSGTHSLSYSFRGPAGGAGIDVTGVPEGSGWKSALSSAQTNPFNTSGEDVVWYWQAYATSLATSARSITGDGTLVVRPNLAAVQGAYDGRSRAEQDLDAVRAEISRRIQGGAVVEYTIGTRSLKREPMEALLALESRLKMQINRERVAQRVANGLGNPNKVFVRFTR